MSWFDRFIPHSRQAREVKQESEAEVLDAMHEQALAVNMAKQSAETRQQIQDINRRNGFSMALGHAFAARRGPA